MENNITLKKNTRQHVAEWIAVILCLAAAPVPCITIMSATKVLSEQWNCLPVWPALLSLAIGAVLLAITAKVLSWVIYLIIK